MHNEPTCCVFDYSIRSLSAYIRVFLNFSLFFTPFALLACSFNRLLLGNFVLLLFRYNNNNIIIITDLIRFAQWIYMNKRCCARAQPLSLIRSLAVAPTFFSLILSLSLSFSHSFIFLSISLRPSHSLMFQFPLIYRKYNHPKLMDVKMCLACPSWSKNEQLQFLVIESMCNWKRKST